MRETKGITLIALVITIIVLLILAGVAISMLTGDNGILRQAANAKTKTEDSAQNELDILNGYEQEINKRTMVKVNGKSTKNGGEWEFDSTTGTITGYTGNETELVFPNYVDGIAVKKIDHPYSTVEDIGDFYNRWGTYELITKIVVSEGIEELGDDVFMWLDNLNEVNLPKTLKKIGDSAFHELVSLKKLEIPSSVTSIDENAFSYNNDLNITIKKGSTLSEKSENYPWGVDESQITFEK